MATSKEMLDFLENLYEEIGELLGYDTDSDEAEED